MEAVIIDQPGAVRVADVKPREPAAGEVRIQVDLVGVCATDAHILHGTFPTAAYPLTPGHEATGVIARLGAGVTSLAEGDRVVIDPGVPCGVCRLCRQGRFNLCEHRNAIGITLPGATAELVTVPAANCHRVLPGTSPRAAVLAEPLACVVHAFDLVRDPAGADVLIYGGGTIGLLAAYCARALGAGSVSVVELDAARAAKAASAGFASAVSAVELGLPDWELVVDATGAVPAIQDALTRLRRGGTLLQIGVTRPDAVVELRPYELFQRELTVAGSMTTRHSFPRALRLLAQGAVDPALIVGTPFAPGQYAAAIASAGSGETLKVTVSPRA
jgi:2-desacetyl-2-hydroxyethyl bacteriochlorophyllide A dehydrogenase